MLISVKNKLPDPDKYVLAAQGDYIFIGVYRRFDRQFHHSDFRQEVVKNVSHWVNLPKPPNEI